MPKPPELKTEAFVKWFRVGHALHPPVGRGDLRHRLRRRGAGRRRVPAAHPRHQRAREPGGARGAGARHAPADRGADAPARRDARATQANRRVTDENGARVREGGQRHRARGDGGAAVDGARQQPHVGRGHPRLVGQLRHREAGGRRGRRRFPAHRARCARSTPRASAGASTTTRWCSSRRSASRPPATCSTARWRTWPPRPRSRCRPTSSSSSPRRPARSTRRARLISELTVKQAERARRRQRRPSRGRADLPAVRRQGLRAGREARAPHQPRTSTARC